MQTLCKPVCLDWSSFPCAGTDAHTAASLLLLYFASLPQPLLPRGMAKFCDHCNLQRSSAVTLLNAVTKPAALATFWATVSLFQDALQPHHGLWAMGAPVSLRSPWCTGNSLTTPALASLLSELWLDAAPNVPLRGSAQAVLAQAALRRMQLMMLMLDGSEEASLL